MGMLKRSSAAGANVLARATEDALQFHIEAYGDAFLKPKHHYMLHMHEQVVADNFYLDCFTHERKHQAIKGCAENIKNKRVFEKSVLFAALNATYEKMNEFVPNTLIGNGRTALGGILSKALRVQGVCIGRGDVLITSEQAWLVQGCLHHGNSLQLVINKMEFVDWASPNSRRWRPTEQLARVSVDTPPLRSKCWYYADGYLVAME